jgi:hypothetical protein
VTPEEYIERLAERETREVSFGVGGIELFDRAGLDDEQEGYVGEGWADSWLVIGRDTAVGDPLFVDLDDPQTPVYTAMHGEGEWDPDRIAASFDGFLAAFDALAAIAEGRDSPVALDANPLSDDERARFLQTVAEANHGVDTRYWEQLVDIA